MASNSKGWKPTSGREHPPKAGAQNCGPMTNHGGGYGAGGNPGNAVIRTRPK